MELETVTYAILDDDELHQLRRCINSCNPASSEHGALEFVRDGVRNRLVSDRKFESFYIQKQIVPYLRWLINHYRKELEYAKSEIKIARGQNVLGDVHLQWKIVVESREEMIKRVQEVFDLFTSAINRIQGNYVQ